MKDPFKILVKQIVFRPLFYGICCLMQQTVNGPIGQSTGIVTLIKQDTPAQCALPTPYQERMRAGQTAGMPDVTLPLAPVAH